MGSVVAGVSLAFIVQLGLFAPTAYPVFRSIYLGEKQDQVERRLLENHITWRQAGRRLKFRDESRPGELRVYELDFNDSGELVEKSTDVYQTGANDIDTYQGGTGEIR
jgi:hypothetical protein